MHAKLILFTLTIGLLAVGLTGPTQAGSAKEFSLVTAMVAEGANLWLPSTIIVHKGDELKFKLRNTAKVEHGFAIDELGIKEVIPPGETKEVTLQPGSKGVLRYYCHLHPGHIGGQLLVED
jgi:nitrosocyanin